MFIARNIIPGVLFEHYIFTVILQNTSLTYNFTDAGEIGLKYSQFDLTRLVSHERNKTQFKLGHRHINVLCLWLFFILLLIL